MAAAQKEAAIEEFEEASIGKAVDTKVVGATPRESKVVEVPEDNDAH